MLKRVTMRRWIVTLLLLANAMLVGWIGWATSPNKTETGHMAAAAYLWQTLRFDVFHVNPPLTRAISGLPVAMCRPEYDWDQYSSQPQNRSEFRLGTSFIEANSPEKVRWYFALARWSLIPLLLVGAYYGYRLSRELYGDEPGIVFLILWSFSPLLLAWGATICPDAAAAALGLVAVYWFRRWLHQPSWTLAIVAGVCLGLLPLAKLTWLLAFGLWPLVWFLWTVPSWLSKADDHSLPRPPVRQLAAILVIALYVLNTGYLFDGSCRPLGQYVFMSQTLSGREVGEDQMWRIVTDNRFAGTWLGTFPVPLPAEFVQGIDTQRYDFERGLPSYLRGQWADHGWWYYYLYAMAVKEPLGTWCLLLLAVGVAIFGRGFNAAWRDEMVVLVPGLVILVFVSGQTGFSVHSRYIISALPFFFIWISKVGRVFEMRSLTRRRLAMAGTVVLALAWSVASSLSIYPHSLSYFNELAALLPTSSDASYPKPIGESGNNHGILTRIKYVLTAGPRNGPRHLLDSNIDWGQDLLYLKDWLDKHPEVTLDGLAFFGPYPATLAGIPETPFPQSDPSVDNYATDRNSIAESDGATWRFSPKPGWYVVSVNYLYDRSRRYCYFLDFEPAASAGYSIYIYHITPDDANRVRGQLRLVELPVREEDEENAAGETGSDR